MYCRESSVALDLLLSELLLYIDSLLHTCTPLTPPPPRFWDLYYTVVLFNFARALISLYLSPSHFQNRVYAPELESTLRAIGTCRGCVEIKIARMYRKC